MAKKFGINNSTSKAVDTIGTLSKMFHTVITGRVRDIILNEAHPEFKKYGEWNGVGTIFYENVKRPINTDAKLLSAALPLFPNIKQYPLLDELVVIVFAPNTTAGNNTTALQAYYMPPLNAWNTQHQNAVPKNVIDPNDFKAIEGGAVKRVSDGNTGIDLGYTFLERTNIHPLISYAGDIIYEGRWGNSIRLGSTVKQTTPYTYNDWSNSGTNGDPILILRNGQSTSYPNPASPNSSLDPWIPVTEQVNNDSSSIYLSSTQNINVGLSSLLNASLSKETNPPAPQSSYNKPQIVINSGRLVLNAKTDAIILSSPTFINLRSNHSINLDSKDTFTVSISQPNTKYENPGNIYLGGVDANKSIILGEDFLNKLELLLNNLQSLSDTLSNLKVPGAPLAPAVGGALFSELLVPSTTLSNVCKDMLSDIRDKNYLSKITKTK
jgi:hypothetical protein